MRYSEYFVQVALLVEKGDVVEAERLLREAERYSQKNVTNHAALCAKAWAWYLKNPDNAIRCLLEAELQQFRCPQFAGNHRHLHRTGIARNGLQTVYKKGYAGGNR